MPTALKVLRGNPGCRPLNESEPQPPDGNVVAPKHLSSTAAIVWADIAPTCIAMGTLTTADVSAFATLCELEATRRAVSALKDAGEDLAKVIKAERQTAVALKSYYEKFGLEPSGRARLHVPSKAAATQVSKWAGLVNG